MYYVLNSDFVLLSPVEGYTSFLWTDRYSEEGDFEIETIPTKANLELYKQDYFLHNTDSDHEMIIEGLKITTDSDEGARLYVTGSSLESILQRRIVWAKTVLEGNLQNGIKKLLDENIISPAESARKIENFIFEVSEDPAVTALEFSGECDKDNLYDVIVSICQTKGLGFKITRNSENQFVFRLYAGRNLVYSETAEKFVIFSPGFDNLKNSEYNNSTKDYVNTVYVTGGNNDASSVVVGEYSGLSRRESHVSAGTIDSGYSGSINDFLTEKGNEELKNKKAEKKFEGDVEVGAASMFQLGVDFSLGDIVQIENEYSIQDAVRVSEIIFSDDGSEKTVYPTFEIYEEETV